MLLATYTLCRWLFFLFKDSKARLARDDLLIDGLEVPDGEVSEVERLLDVEEVLLEDGVLVERRLEDEGLVAELLEHVLHVADLGHGLLHRGLEDVVLLALLDETLRNHGSLNALLVCLFDDLIIHVGKV